MHLKGPAGIENSVDTDQTEQSDLGRHYFLRVICPNT